MARKSNAVSATTAMRTTRSTGVTGDSTLEKDGFIFGWEGTSIDPLMYEARAVVDAVWPDTPTPDVVNGLWDETPIMRAVLAALRRGIAIGQGDDIASA